jgi:hypothetical protein
MNSQILPCYTILVAREGPLMKLLTITFMLTLLWGCKRSDVPNNRFEQRMLNAVLQEAKKRGEVVPEPYSFQIYEDTLILEMRPSVKVWVVEISRKGDTNHPVVSAMVEPTNYHVTAFSVYGKGTIIERLIERTGR